MDNQEPVTRTVTISDAKRELSSLVEAVRRNGARVIMERDGVPVAALVAADDLARLEELDRKWEEHTRAMERFSEAFAEIPTEEAEAEIARIIADIRREEAAEAERQSA